MKKRENRIIKENGPGFFSGWKVLIPAFLLISLTFTGCGKPADETPVLPEPTTGAYHGAVLQKPATAADLYSLEICSYSGQFMEDNTFEEVENVAAMKLENRSMEFLDLATITYDLGDGKEAVFEVKGLPAGETVLVLEKNRLPLTGNETFTGYPEVEASFNKSAITSTSDISVTEKDGVLTVSNLTRGTLENVTIYYKLTDSEGNFLGGIAYVSSVGTLKPQESKEKEAPLFAQNAKIVKYSYQKG